MSKREKVIDFIREHSLVRPKDLKDIDLPRDYLYQLAQEGVIERVGRGLYQWPDKDLGRHHSLAELSMLAVLRKYYPTAQLRWFEDAG